MKIKNFAFYFDFYYSQVLLKKKVLFPNTKVRKYFFRMYIRKKSYYTKRMIQGRFIELAPQKP